MTRAVRTSQVLVVVALALAGVGLGHVGEYLLLAPDHHERQALLARTGHHYLPSALSAVVFVALLGLALVFLLGLARGLTRVGHRGGRLRWSHALAAAQVLAFTALEVGERLAAHASLADLGVILAVGLPLQAVVGFLAGRLVAQVEVAGERLGHRLRATRRHARRSTPAGWRPNPSSGPAMSPSAVALPARGPPRLFVPA